MTYLSHIASFHSNERIAPSNRGIKHVKSGKQLTGLLFSTSGSNLFLSDGERTKVIDLGSVDSIADVPAVTKKPVKPVVEAEEAQAITRQ